MLRSNPHREISRWHGRSHSLSSPDSLSLYACITSTFYLNRNQTKPSMGGCFVHATIPIARSSVGKTYQSLLARPQRIRGIRTDNGTSRFSIWYYRDFRLDDRWNHRWNRSGKRWTQKMALAYGLEYFPHLRYIRLPQLLPTR